ncbi:phosphoribosyltransferase [Candidatus Parcubacteria bacterium]|nr:MAG: phosphoribosyltransferase [Candidatus Parcubacteria bacterium]
MDMRQRFVFDDRSAAGVLLAEKLLEYKSARPLILALPRGGVPVAYEVAVRLDAPLDTVVVCKIGAPFNPEMGVGAVAPGSLVLDDPAIMQLGLSKRDLDPIIVRETEEMQRRKALYRSGAYVDVAAYDTIILVDDGLATGVSARVAIESLRKNSPSKRLIFATPVCSSDGVDMIRNSVERVICVHEVDNFIAVGYWYREFEQTSDEEVIALLERVNMLRS